MHDAVDRRVAPPSRWDHVLGLVFVLVVTVPGLALLAGVRPPQLENAAAAPWPSLDVPALGEPRTYSAVDSAIIDRLPGRDVAVGAYAGLDYRLLGGSIDRQVVVGRGSWLWYRGELEPTCSRSAADLLGDVDTIGAAGAAAGVDVHVTIAPDKHAIHPTWLPEQPTFAPCTDGRRAELRAGFAARPSTTTDLWSVVLAARDGASEPIYFDQDSHWRPEGALPAIGAVVDAVVPGLWSAKAYTASRTDDFPMELARLNGLPRSASIPHYRVRPDERVERRVIDPGVHLAHAADVTDYRVSGPLDTVPGTTLIVYDSFFNIERPLLIPWFERSIWVQSQDLRDHPELAARLPRIDHIVMERVERDAYGMDIAALLQPVLDARASATP
jgi:hypothetical protein